MYHNLNAKWTDTELEKLLPYESFFPFSIVRAFANLCIAEALYFVKGRKFVETQKEVSYFDRKEVEA